MQTLAPPAPTQTLAVVLESGELEGYQPGAPRGAGESDAEVCREAHCANCRHQGLEYHPYTSTSGRSYRAFAVCPRCQQCAEF